MSLKLPLYWSYNRVIQKIFKTALIIQTVLIIETKEYKEIRKCLNTKKAFFRTDSLTKACFFRDLASYFRVCFSLWNSFLDFITFCSLFYLRRVWIYYMVLCASNRETSNKENLRNPISQCSRTPEVTDNPHFNMSF